MSAFTEVARPQIAVNKIPKNPLDKCTIVSVFPESIREIKRTLFPGVFEIPAAKDNDFSILVIGASSWFKEQQDGPILEMYCSSPDVAKSVVTDYVNGLVGYTPDIAAPGLFYCLGEYNKTTILKYVDPVTKKTFEELLTSARTRQKNWFLETVKMTDVDWARSGGNPLVVSKDAKLAADKLGMKEKPWMFNQAISEKSNCPACGFMINPAYPVCSNCKAIVNKDLAAERKIAFAI